MNKAATSHSGHLLITCGHQKVGMLSFSQDEVTLVYHPTWQTNGFALSPHLPLTGSYSSIEVKRYLDNLFPEGQGFDEILEESRISKKNRYAILKLIGEDSTGAFKFTPQENAPHEKPVFREIPLQELSQRLSERSRSSLLIWDGKVRLSIAGVQDKLVVVERSDGKIGFGEGSLASTHILKFQKNNPDIPHFVLNEYFCMRLAEAIGLETAKTEYLKIGQHSVLKVQRFDRNKINDEHVEKLHVIDGCQALNLPATYKYEQNFGSGRDVANIRDGVSLPKLFQFVQNCKIPAKETMKLIQWCIFNLCIANYDNHGKNLSYFVDQTGVSSTPFYDLVNTSMYPKIEQHLALAIGDEFDPQSIFTYQLAVFSDTCGLKRRLVRKQLILITDRILKTLQAPDFGNSNNHSPQEAFFLTNLKENIQGHTDALKKQAIGLESIKS